MPPGGRPARAAAGRSTSPWSTREGNAVSLIESNYMGFGSGVVDPDTGIHYQNRGSYFSLDPDHPNVLAPGKRTLHTLLPGMLFRDGERRPWVVDGSMGGDAQPQIHAQVVSALVDGGVDVATAVGAPRWFVEPATRTSRRRRRPRRAALRGRAPRRARGAGPPGHAADPFDSPLGHAHAIELVDGGPAEAARSRPRPTRGARACRPSGEARTARSTGRDAGDDPRGYTRRGRWLAALTRRRHRPRPLHARGRGP